MRGNDHPYGDLGIWESGSIIIAQPPSSAPQPMICQLFICVFVLAAAISGMPLWLDVATDATGQYLAAVNTTNLVLSNDFGHTWQSIMSNTDTFKFTGIYSDSTGQTLIASTSCGITPPYCADVSLYISHDRGGKWTPSVTKGTFSSYLIGNSSSAYLWAHSKGVLHKSLNGGLAWEEVLLLQDSSYASGGMAMNPSGEHLYLSVGQYIMTSHDSGVSFKNTLRMSPSDGDQWVSIATDNSGKFIAAAALWGAYVSQDGGLTWKLIAQKRLNTYGGFSSVAMDESGSHIYLTEYDWVNNDARTYSYDLATGKLLTLKSWTSDEISATATSANGTVLVAAGQKALYTSVDGGKTWY